MATNTFYVWHGFDHMWNYNHRMNRLGSYLDVNNSKVVHTGASGTGRDTLEYRDLYSKIETEHVTATQGNLTFCLHGTEDYIYKEERSVDIKVDDKENEHVVLLQGFDIYSNDDSDSLLILDIELENTRIEGDCFKFDVVVHLNVDCKTVECKPLNKEFDYTLEVYYQILSCNKENVMVNFLPVHKNKYNWNKKAEIFKKVFGFLKRSNYLPVDAKKYPIVTGGFKRIGVNINYKERQKAPHMLELSMAINHIYIKSRYQYTVLESQFFKNWRRGMRSFNFASLFAFRRDGSFIGLSEIILIHIKKGKIKSNMESRGWLEWLGANRPSNDPAGMKEHKLL